MRRLVIAITIVIVGLVVWKASQQRFGTTDVQITEEIVRPGPADADAPREFTTTRSGLQYRILRNSTEPNPTATDTVLVHYRGWLDSGKVFDSSYRRGKPAAMDLARVIPGWTEGLQLVGKGGMIELIVPPRLGYGSRGGSDIPANSTLHFLVEIFDIGVQKETKQEDQEDKDVREPGPIDADAPTEYMTTPGGAKYRILRKSSGRKPTTVDQVAIHLRTFDEEGLRRFSTYGREEPQLRPVGMLPKQVQEVLQNVGEGGMVEIIVPQESGSTPKSDGAQTGKQYRFQVELFKVVDQPSSGPIDADAPKEYTTTESGLKYRILRKSEGTHPQYGDRVRVHYRLWFEGGGDVENSYANGAPFEFVMSGEVIKGWQEGLQHVGEGGMIELIVPPALGYGVLGSPPRIPGDTTLHFAIEVLKVN